MDMKNNIEEHTEWIYCLACGNKTRLQIREDTELKNFPLYCPKCKRKKRPCGYFLGAVSIKAFAVALTTSNDRSSQAESIRM